MKTKTTTSFNPTNENLLIYATTHSSPVPQHIKPHLCKLLAVASEYHEALITRAVTAELVGIGAGRLAIRACEGDFDLPVVKCGRNVRYKLGDIKAFLDRNTHSALQEATNERP